MSPFPHRARPQIPSQTRAGRGRQAKPGTTGQVRPRTPRRGRSRPRSRQSPAEYAPLGCAPWPHRPGWVMSCGRTHKSKCSALRNPSLRAASRKLMSSRYAVGEIFAAFSYPMCGLRAVTSMSELSRCSFRTFVRLDPVAQRGLASRAEWFKAPARPGAYICGMRVARPSLFSRAAFAGMQ
jgi:hypothetical protein